MSFKFDFQLVRDHEIYMADGRMKMRRFHILPNNLPCLKLHQVLNQATKSPSTTWYVPHSLTYGRTDPRLTHYQQRYHTHHSLIHLSLHLFYAATCSTLDSSSSRKIRSKRTRVGIKGKVKEKRSLWMLLRT